MIPRHIRFVLLVCLAAAGLAVGWPTTLRGQDADTQATAEPSEASPDDPQPEAGSAATPGVDNVGLVAICSIVIAGLTIAIGSIGPALGEGRAVSQALTSIAQQPDSSNTITRTLFVGLAMIESTAIYCFVVSMILLYANPFWDHFSQ